MRIIRNERRIRRYQAIGQYATLGGLSVLLIGLIISFVRPTWMIPLILSLGLGFLLSVVGGYFADRYTGPLAQHEALAEMLKGLDYRHTLIQYLLPADHVLLGPGGCTCFVVKAQGGEVTYEDEEDGRWRHKQRGKFFRQLVGQEALARPHVEAEQEAERLRRYLNEHMAQAERVPVRGVIAFVNEDVEVEADESPAPAFYRKKVKDWLRGAGDLEPLPDDVGQELAETLGVAEGV